MTAVIWIDWYAYHVARFRALSEHSFLKGNVRGLELVGGCGVHQKLLFRETERGGLPIDTVLPEHGWEDAGPIRIAYGVWQALTRLKPSSILVPGYYNVPAVCAAIWGRLHGRRTILMSETTRADYRRVWWKEFGKKLLIRSLFARAVAGGSPHIRYLEELGFRRDRIARCYDVVDNDWFRTRAADVRAKNTRAEYGFPESYFLFVGRLAPEKNVLGLLQAFSTYREEGGNWSLVLAGDGPLREELQSRVERLKLGNCVRVEGMKTTQELVPYYAFANCFVLPSTREPWGLVVNEAMATGLPVLVSSQCGCCEDLVSPGRNGFSFDAYDLEPLKQHFVRLENMGERDRRLMGDESQQIIAAYSLDSWASEIARLVRS